MESPFVGLQEEIKELNEALGMACEIIRQLELENTQMLTQIKELERRLKP